MIDGCRFQFAAKCFVLAAGIATLATGTLNGQTPAEATFPKIAKVFGSGGMHRLEAWQTAIAISSDGLFVTAWSYVLDGGATLVLDDGRRFEAHVIGHHPQAEIALLKIDIAGQPHFMLDSATEPVPGMPILAWSNLFGIATGNERVSVQRGVVSAVGPVQTRRGVRITGYLGPALLVDAVVSNPGAAGGAITELDGSFLGMIGRESMDADSGLWLNYVIPAARLRGAISEIQSGRAEEIMPVSRPSEPVTQELLGLLLVPGVLSVTPPWVEQVVAGSAAERAGLRSDDLIVEVDGKPTATRNRVLEQFAMIDRDRKFSLTIERDGEYRILEILPNR